MQEAEHFGGVAAAAEHDEEACGRPAFSALGLCGVGRGEDVEEVELGGVV